MANPKTKTATGGASVPSAKTYDPELYGENLGPAKIRFKRDKLLDEEGLDKRTGKIRKAYDPVEPVTFDYTDPTEFPVLPREGLRGDGNSRFLTLALFLEFCPDGQEKYIKWTFADSEKISPITGQVYPSAWRVYVESRSEYDAMRKLVGSLDQWEHLKKQDWFLHNFRKWSAELDMKNRSEIKTALVETIRGGGGGAVTAAKMLLTEFPEDHSPRPPRNKNTKIKKELKAKHALAKKLAEQGVSTDAQQQPVKELSQVDQDLERILNGLSK